MHDIFISHASEDKEEVVRPIALALVDKGLDIWYDEFSLALGDSLSESIDTGLSSSRFGIVILSKNFFNKGWPKRELRGLVARDIDEGKIILPIWHNVTKQDVVGFSPPLADLLAADTGSGVERLVDEILNVVAVDKHRPPALARAFVLMKNGHYQAAILSAGTFLEEHLKNIALNHLGYKFFKKTPIKFYSLGPVIKLLDQKKILKTKTDENREHIHRITRLRNESAHSTTQPSKEQAEWMLAEVEELARINR
jgi:hypothetical protein